MPTATNYAHATEWCPTKVLQIGHRTTRKMLLCSRNPLHEEIEMKNLNLQVMLLSAGVSKLRPAKPFQPAAKTVHIKKLYIYENFVDLVECSVSGNNHIT